MRKWAGKEIFAVCFKPGYFRWAAVRLSSGGAVAHSPSAHHIQRSLETFNTSTVFYFYLLIGA